MTPVDLCVVAGRRPDLLAATLKSFSSAVFAGMPPARVLVNIDPIFGDDADATRCVETVRAHFSDAEIFQPATAGFCAAVRRLWQATTADFIFHLEDDWIVTRPFGEEMLTPFGDRSIAQVVLHHADQNWDVRRKGHFHRCKGRFNILGLRIPSARRFPKFSTSPSVLRGAFARRAAQLMDESYDPEKQFYSRVNGELERFVKPYRNYIFSPDGIPVIADIGKQWRVDHLVRKVITDAATVWEHE